VWASAAATDVAVRLLALAKAAAGFASPRSPTKKSIFCIFFRSFTIYYNMYKIFDLHNDYFLKIRSDRQKTRYVDKKSKMAESIVSAVWTSELSLDESIAEIERARDFINANKKLYLGVEDLHFLSKQNLEKFLLMRPLYAGLTWNMTNCIGGGSYESGKLTNFGKLVLKRLEENNIRIDTAHLNEETFSDVCKLSSHPIFCSHTAFYGANAHVRNLKDYQLRMIVDSGGLVGLCFVSDFVTGKKTCTPEDIAAQIDYFACKFGTKNLALGTDFYGTKHLPKSLKNYDSVSNKLAGILEKMGYTQKAINNIFYDNAYNFLCC